MQQNWIPLKLQTYYKYQGDAGYDAHFVLDETFINAVEANNVKMNIYLIQFDQSKINLDDRKDIEKFKVYGQTIYINKDETKDSLFV